MTYTDDQAHVKHGDSSRTEHFIAVCPECGVVLMECGSAGGPCDLDKPKPIRWRDCTNGSLLLKRGEHLGLKAGLK